MENYIKSKLFDKNMTFWILVVHNLTNDISYVSKLNRSKNCYFGGKIVKIPWKNRRKWENICFIHISRSESYSVLSPFLSKLRYAYRRNRQNLFHGWERLCYLNCHSALRRIQGQLGVLIFDYSPYHLFVTLYPVYTFCKTKCSDQCPWVW